MPRIKQAEAPKKELQVEFDAEQNLVFFEVNDRKLAIREPIAKDFMHLESWMRSPSKTESEELEKRDVNFIAVRMASICSVASDETQSISYKSLCDSLVTFDDVERVATAIGFFQDQLTEYFKRLTSKTAD